MQLDILSAIFLHEGIKRHWPTLFQEGIPRLHHLSVNHYLFCLFQRNIREQIVNIKTTHKRL